MVLLQEVLHEKLKHLCRRLSSGEHDDCKSRVDTYLPEIAQMVRAEMLTPRLVTACLKGWQQSV